jgi:hypothetical protein
VFVATKAGQCVSVDQLILTQVGLIAHQKGTLTKKCYTAATVFVNHYSKLKYIHLMTKLTSEDTMEAKRTFEHFTKQHGVCILHYHCNKNNLQTTPSRTAAVQRVNVLLFVGSMPTSRMALRKKPSGTSARVQGSSSSIHANNG